jgi:hypothetical protein
VELKFLESLGKLIKGNKMKTFNDIIFDLEKIQLFKNCGKKFDIIINFEIVTLNSWIEVVKSYTDVAWEEITEEAQGILTSYLSQKCSQEYHGQWNKIVREIRPRLEEIVDPQVIKLIKQENLDYSLKDIVRWDILHYVMEMIYYERGRCTPPIFFKNIFEIYKNGHLPCGWEGMWPNGKLKIY